MNSLAVYGSVTLTVFCAMIVLSTEKTLELSTEKTLEPTQVRFGIVVTNPKQAMLLK